MGRKSRAHREQTGQAKVRKVMHEWKAGTLHSGSPRGPKVTSRKQAVAIALSAAAGRERAPEGDLGRAQAGAGRASGGEGELMAKRWSGGPARVRQKPEVRKKGLSQKPPHPGGNPGTIEGLMMLQDRLPRRKK
jgi:hypothetical protein